MNQAPNTPIERWFLQLTTVGMQGAFAWLAPLKNSVKQIVNWGCWTGAEPFALLWTLDATEMVIVEKEQDNLKAFEEQREILEKKLANSLIGRGIQVKIADMTTQVDGLPDNYFDLAYCEEVLYYMQEDYQALQNAINEMTRVTKSGGLVIAVESKFKAQFEEVEHPIFKKIPVQVTEPEDISQFFEAAGLTRISLHDAPDYSYCYIKP